MDLTDFLIRDATNMAPQLTPGSYRLDNSRSTIYMPMTMNFPKNTEMEAELTFIPQAGAGGGRGGRGGRGGGAFEGVGNVAATGEAASLRVHQSFVELSDGDYTPRMHDPRSGFGAFTFADYSAPLGESITKRFIPRHRLKKRNPAAAVSDPVKPITYYLDPGTPEPVRTALVDGGRWWDQAFTAAGYRNAFRFEMLPEGANSHDIRYNVVNWVHRSTRGWSSGASVTDPRTGEIIKGVVTLGSLRIRQDWMIFEGLLQPYLTGDEKPAEIERWSLQRIRQLAAHEIGHTLGLGHNYYNSDAGRISVMDYPQPLVTLRPTGTLDVSQAYTNEIGEWDKVTIAYGYQDFPPGTNEPQALRQILDRAWARDIRYLTNQDLRGSPRVDQWVNGTDQAAELLRMMEVRRVAPSSLALPEPLLKKIPPRPPGYGNTRELFPRNTGLMFDAVFAATAPSASHTAHEAEVQRAIERVALDGVMELAEGAGMPQARAIATLRLRRRSAELAQVAGAAPAAAADAGAAHAALLAADIRRFLERPATPAARTVTPAAPPGAPIGEPAMEWLRRIEPPCSWWYEWQW